MTPDSNATPTPSIKVAFVLAAPMVWRAQHDGSHEQDRWDAMAWLEVYRPTGYVRCQCGKCEKLWEKASLAETGGLMGVKLSAHRAREAAQPGGDQ